MISFRKLFSAFYFVLDAFFRLYSSPFMDYYDAIQNKYV